MKDQLDTAKETLGGISALFAILWFIAALTSILGRFDYEVEFLQLAVGFHLLSRIPTAFRKRYSATKKLQKLFTNIGWPLIGIWILFSILRWIGWFGEMEIGVDINYFLAGGFFLVVIGHAVKAARQKSPYWAARSVLFTIGIVSIFFWVLTYLFDIFQQHADLIIILGLFAIGFGFILGGIRKRPAFFVEVEEEEEPHISEDVYVVDQDLSINQKKARVEIKNGSLYIPVTSGKEIGGIYFGAGSYHVDAAVKEYTDVYKGITMISGSEWDSVKSAHSLHPADQQAFETMGLSKEEVLELARLQLKGKFTDELKRKLKKTEINLPFIKVRDTPQGSHVKVGPIEVKDGPGHEHVRIGPWEFDEYGDRKRFTSQGLVITIRSKDEDITIRTNGNTEFIRGDQHIIVNHKIKIRTDDIDLLIEEDKKILRSAVFKLFSKDDRRILQSDGFKLTLKEDTGTIKKNGKSVHITDPDTLEDIRSEIDIVADELIRNVLDQKELTELNTLIKKFEQELG
jgi:hypothetical protein